jgi:hypothetical protein
MTKLLKNIELQILDPLIYFMIALAFIYFVWGVVEYLMNAENPEARSKGRSHMIWGIVGLSIMIGVFGIIQLIVNTLGVNT